MTLKIATSLFVVLALTGCPGNPDHKTSIGHTLKGDSPTKFDKNTLGDNKDCLKLGTFVSTLNQDTTYNVYVSDVNLGTLDQQMRLTPVSEEGVRAKLALVTYKPTMDQVTGKDLLASPTLKDLLAVESQEGCSTITYKGGAKFAIFGSKSGVLRARSSDGEIREYLVDPSGIMYVNSYKQTDYTSCDGSKKQAILKLGYMATWNDNMDFILLEPGYAQLIANNINEPPEFSTALQKATTGANRGDESVRIPEPIYRRVEDLVDHGDFSNLCK